MGKTKTRPGGDVGVSAVRQLVRVAAPTRS